MPKRAKCKICNTIIESKNNNIIEECKCGQLSIQGGTELIVSVKEDITSFVCVDDEGNEILPKRKENPEKLDSPTKEELLETLQHLARSIDELPPHAKFTPVIQSELSSLLALIISLFRIS